MTTQSYKRTRSPVFAYKAAAPHVVEAIDWKPSSIGPTAEFVRVTPRLAQKLLNQMIDNNRRSSSPKVEIYGRDILEGNWDVNGESIKVTLYGETIDGEHRLRAIIATGVPVVLLVVSGLDPQVIRSIDAGRARTQSNQFAMADMPNAAHLSGVVSLAYTFTRSGWRGHNVIGSHPHRPSVAEAFEFVQEHPEVHDLVKYVNRASHAGLGGSAAYGAFAWVTHQADPVLSETFMEAIITGAGLQGNSPILVGRNRIIKERSTPSGATQDVVLYLLARAWNGWMLGEQITKFQVSKPVRIPNLIGLEYLYEDMVAGEEEE